MSMKVIKIINQDKIVINAGNNFDIEKGDKFEIYVEGEDLIDNEGTNYGKLNFVKAEIEAVQVEDKLSICANTKHELTGILQVGMGLQQKRRKSLDVDPTEISGMGDINDDYIIRIGDNIRKLERI